MDRRSESQSGQLTLLTLFLSSIDRLHNHSRMLGCGNYERSRFNRGHQGQAICLRPESAKKIARKTIKVLQDWSSQSAALMHLKMAIGNLNRRARGLARQLAVQEHRQLAMLAMFLS
jgi:hypothetical protein